MAFRFMQRPPGRVQAQPAMGNNTAQQSLQPQQGWPNARQPQNAMTQQPAAQQAPMQQPPAHPPLAQRPYAQQPTMLQRLFGQQRAAMRQQPQPSMAQRPPMQQQPPAMAQRPPMQQQPPMAQRPYPQQQPAMAQRPLAQQQPPMAQRPLAQQPPMAQRPPMQQPPMAQRPHPQQQPPMAQRPHPQQQPPMAQRPHPQQQPAATQQRPQTQQPAPLPDGVTYQPLDERTIAEISKIAPNHPAVAAFRQSQQSQPQPAGAASAAANKTAAPSPAPIPAQTTTLPQMPPLTQGPTLGQPAAPAFPLTAEPQLLHIGLSERLEELMQGEHNGAAYYKGLASITQNSEYAKTLHEISENCKARAQAYGGVYKTHHSKDFSAVDRPVMPARSFRQGVNLAIEEENHVIKNLIALYESLPDSDSRHAVGTQLKEKLNDIMLLHKMG